jgi:DNA invertase Pin-like site-specific DNA recombinase
MFTPHEIARIEKMLREGLTASKIAAAFGLDQNTFTRRLNLSGYNVGRVLVPLVPVKAASARELAEVGA